MRSTGWARDRPAAPNTCTASVVARMAASVETSLASAAQTLASRDFSRSMMVIAFSHRARAAATSAVTSASRNWSPWCSMIGLPNCSRCLA